MKPTLDDIIDYYNLTAEGKSTLDQKAIQGEFFKRYPEHYDSLVAFITYKELTDAIPDRECTEEEERELVARAQKVAQSVIEGRCLKVLEQQCVENPFKEPLPPFGGRK